MKKDFALILITGMMVFIIPFSIALTMGGQVGAFQPPTSPNTTMVQDPISQTVSVPAITLPPVTPSASEASNANPSIGEESTAIGTVAPPPKGSSTATTAPPVTKYQFTRDYFKVLNLENNKVEKVSIEDYVRGAIAAEMPASFHEQALTAQGVSALTYGIFHALYQGKNPDPTLKGADFSADPENRKGYMTEKQAKAFFGNNKDYNWDKVCKAADTALKHVLLYEGEPIPAAYHAISSGNTEDAVHVWDKPMPCLTAVDSSWDILASGYKTSVVISQEEIRHLLEPHGITLLPNEDTWFTIEERSYSGYITKVRVGNRTLTGNQLRNMLGLRSSHFQIERQGKDFLFIVVGYGHGVGLSQNGADYMARQNKSFMDILSHYYPDVTIAELEI